jgi:hypothetical protein
MCTRFARITERNHSRHLIASENWENKSVLINHFVIIFKILRSSNNWRKSYVSAELSMFSRMLLCSRQKRTTCFSDCVSQSHEQIEMKTISTRRWKKYFVRFIRLMRICVIKLFSILIRFSCNFKRFLKTRVDSVTQIFRSFRVWYSF